MYIIEHENTPQMYPKNNIRFDGKILSSHFVMEGKNLEQFKSSSNFQLKLLSAKLN